MSPVNGIRAIQTKNLHKAIMLNILKCSVARGGQVRKQYGDNTSSLMSLERTLSFSDFLCILYLKI